MKILGIDFTSSPTKRKPVLVAVGVNDGGSFCLEGLRAFEAHAAMGDFLQSMPAWVAGFDLPFALPRELLEHLAWPHLAAKGKSAWQIHIEHLQTLSRPQMVAAFRAFCDARPAGKKFAHRACDRPAGSSPSMKWVNPPVALMLHAGAPVILALGASLPGMHRADPQRIALEAYPGFLARKLLGARSYKSDDKTKQTPERLGARKQLVEALLSGTLIGQGLAYPRLVAGRQDLDQMISDASGDHLDAVLCAIQAAWGVRHKEIYGSNYGLPEMLDALEGWIVSVPPDN